MVRTAMTAETGMVKQLRRLATRYEKRAENYRAMWIIAAILLWP